MIKGSLINAIEAFIVKVVEGDINTDLEMAVDIDRKIREIPLTKREKNKITCLHESEENLRIRREYGISQMVTDSYINALAPMFAINISSKDKNVIIAYLLKCSATSPWNIYEHRCELIGNRCQSGLVDLVAITLIINAISFLCAHAHIEVPLWLITTWSTLSFIGCVLATALIFGIIYTQGTGRSIRNKAYNAVTDNRNLTQIKLEMKGENEIEFLMVSANSQNVSPQNHYAFFSYKKQKSGPLPPQVLTEEKPKEKQKRRGTPDYSKWPLNKPRNVLSITSISEINGFLFKKIEGFDHGNFYLLTPYTLLERADKVFHGLVENPHVNKNKTGGHGLKHLIKGKKSELYEIKQALVGHDRIYCTMNKGDSTEPVKEELISLLGLPTDSKIIVSVGYESWDVDAQKGQLPSKENIYTSTSLRTMQDYIVAVKECRKKKEEEQVVTTPGTPFLVNYAVLA
jgi:hypothetical protein